MFRSRPQLLHLLFHSLLPAHHRIWLKDLNISPDHTRANTPREAEPLKSMSRIQKSLAKVMANSLINTPMMRIMTPISQQFNTREEPARGETPRNISRIAMILILKNLRIQTMM